MRIALDAFGGDQAPQSTLDGAVLALERAEQSNLTDLSITLFGEVDRLSTLKVNGLPESIKFFETPRLPSEGTNVPHAEGENPNSPIRKALQQHHSGAFDAVVSAGPTGSQVLASLVELEKCHGITRPAIGSTFPMVSGQGFLLDVGASLTASPHHMVQFATIGHVYARELLGIDNPRIGVINVGSERGIGDRSATETYRLLADSGFNFIGFVEGRDITTGVADVLVTNGLTGNVLLKFMEVLPSFLGAMLPAGNDPSILNKLKKRFNYEQSGGVPLLGVKGVSIICHGNSNKVAISSAILKAASITRLELHQKIEDFLIDKFESYFSKVKYLRSFRPLLRIRENDSRE